MELVKLSLRCLFIMIAKLPRLAFACQALQKVTLGWAGSLSSLVGCVHHPPGLDTGGRDRKTRAAPTAGQ